MNKFLEKYITEKEKHKINEDTNIVFFPPIISSTTPPNGIVNDIMKYIIGNKKYP